MPKVAKAVGRKAVMDAFCHMCREYCADGVADCRSTLCPLYTYCPYATQEADVSWVNIRPGKAIGFTPRKGVDPHIFQASVQNVVDWKYGGAPEYMPPLLQKQCTELGVNTGGVGIISDPVGSDDEGTPW